MSKSKKFKFHIIITSCGRQIKDIYHSAKEESSNLKFDTLVKENHNSVVFPVKFINNHGIKDANYEIILIKCREKNDPPNTLLRDETGKFITYTASNADWVVLRRDIYYKEECFWVYGYHPRLDRKPFNWIFNTLINKGNSKYQIKNVIAFRNKLIVDTNNKLDIVFCKNADDCIRLYNQLEETSIKKKAKFIIWGGNGYTKYQKGYWYKKIMDFTGWSYDKVRRKSLRP